MALEPIKQIEFDIDLRLRYLWDEMGEADERGQIGDLTLVAAFVRWAYGQGYQDGQREPLSKLHRDNGFSASVD